MPKNYMEIVIDNFSPALFNEYKTMCTCSTCIEDIKALALNNLKPLYIVTEEGYAYAKAGELNLQFKPDVVQQLILAIDAVTSNPRHP